MSKKQDNTHAVDCICGTTPEVISKLAVISKATLYVYKCPKCGREGEMMWEKDSVNLIGSWNNTIRLFQLRNKS